MQLDVDPAVLREILNRPVLQLAIDGSNPLPVLEDLAKDEAFRGDVWVSLRMENLFGQPEGRAQEYAAHFRETRGNWNARWNTVASAAVDSRLALRSGITSLRRLLSGNLPRPSYVSMRRDRYKAADHTMLEIEAHRARRIDRTRKHYERWNRRQPALNLFEERLAMLDKLVQKIQQRGGKVSLIRLPVGPALWDISESAFPRAVFWDRLASRSSATVVHYRDEPSLSSYPLPDESHLDFREAPAFSRALAIVVASR